MKKLQHILYAIFGWLCVLIPAHAQWNTFLWAKSTVPGLLSNKAALLFPVKLDGWSCYMQFDTGVDASILYRNSLPEPYSSRLNQDTLSIDDFSVRGMAAEKVSFPLLYARDEVHHDDGCVVDGDTKVIGSLGNDRFLHGSLSLDLSGARFQFRAGAYTPTAPPGRYDVAPFELVDTGKGVIPILTVEDGDRSKHLMLLDTGSAPAGLIVYLKKRWMRLTGAETGTATSFTTLRWNKPISCYAAPLKNSLSLNGKDIPLGTTVTYCEMSDEIATENNPVFGIIGLSLFAEKVVTLDYVAKKIYFESRP